MAILLLACFNFFFLYLSSGNVIWLEEEKVWWWKLDVEDSYNNHSKETNSWLCAVRIYIHMQGFLSPRSKVQGRSAARSYKALIGQWVIAFHPNNRNSWCNCANSWLSQVSNLAGCWICQGKLTFIYPNTLLGFNLFVYSNIRKLKKF